MKWSALRNLVWTPPDKRWDGDLFFVPATVFVFVWLYRVENHLIVGIVAGICTLALREVLYHYLVRRKRSSGTHAA